MAFRRPTPAEARDLLLTLGAASAGGLAFKLAGLPAPWLSGAMIGATIALLLRVNLIMPDALRDAVMFLLGLSMGASLSPETLTAVAKWPLSLVALALIVVAIMAASMAVTARFGWDRETSFYASAPGALSTVMVLAAASRADVRRVVVAQSLRIFVLVALLPSIVGVIDPGAVSTAIPQAPPRPNGMLTGAVEWAAIVGAALIGVGLCRLIRLPAAILVGAFLGSAAVHAPGVVSAPVPEALLIPAFVVLGAYIALRFKGTTFAMIRADILVSTAAFIVIVAVALVGAIAVHSVLGIPLAEALVAFAPGGLEAMIIMAFALSLDVAYVSVHHLARFTGIATILPLVAKAMFPAPLRKDT